MALAAGTRLGPYEIVGLLGAGGMGEVYSARDTRLGRKVALKVLRSEVASDPDRLRRFEREARTVAALNHPHILTVHDVGTQDSIPYVVTELLEGETLRELLKSRSPTQKQVLTFAVQIARGLAAAHDKDIVHRDLKPENLFLTTDGRIKILDFGLAKLTTREADIRSADTLGKEQFTSPGVILGTVAYMSPEQARALPLDPRTDIFSFGVVLYEMLAHKHPFLRDTAPATLVAILNETPPDLASLGRGIPPALGSLVQRCLEKEKQDRFRGTHDLALALETMLQAPSGVAALEEVEERSPYPGLSSFTEKDAPVFFGREGEVTTLWEKLRSRNLLAVIGPSGAGKTSFVRAGVLPARPPGWAALVCAPGRAPMRALARALAPELAGDTEALTRLPDFEELDVAVSLLGQWRRAHDEALVVVDQFEELFTLGSPEAQERFAELIGRLTREADVHVLLSLRDDFLMRCHQHEPLARVFSELTPLDTLTREGLRRAVTEPARTRDCAFGDESLIDEMVGSVEGTRAALPLLAFAVSRLWEKRDRERKLLTRTAYEEIGGVAGALAQHAEQTLERVGAGRQGMVREIFRNLVTSQGTRASSDREELLSIFPEREAAEEVLDELIDARLLTSYEVSETREPDKSGEATLQSRHWIEIVHESLLKAWPRLVMWQAQEEEGAVLRDQLKQAAHLWEEKDRSPDLLWSGTAFREFELWRDRYPGKLTALEEDFSTSMIRRARRQRRARRGAVVAAFLVLVGVAGTIAVSRQQAVDSARRAEASQLLALAQARFTEDPTEALAFTVASLEVADGEEARLFAMRVLEVAPPALEVEPGGYRHVAVAFSPSGGRLAVGGGEKVRVLSAEPEDRPIGVSALEGEGEDLPHGGFRGDWASNELLVTSQLKSSSGVSIWSLTGGGERVRAIDFGEPSSWQVGPNLLLAETPEDVPDRVVSRLRSWPLPDGDPVDLGRVDRSALGVSTSAFLPNGTGWLYAKGDGVYLRPLPSGRGQDRLLGRHPAEVRGVWPLQGEPLRMCSLDVTGEVRVWALSQQEPALVRVISPQEDSSQPASAWRAPDPTLRWAAGFDEKGQQIRVWNLEARPEARPLRLRRSGSWFISSFEFHPRGTWLAATTRGAQHVTFWPLPRARPRVMDGYTLPVRPLAFSPDGRWLATNWGVPGLGSYTDALRLWPLPGSTSQEVKTLKLSQRGGWTHLVFDPQGRFLFVVETSDRAYVVPLDGSPVQALDALPGESDLGGAAVSPSGRRVATAFGTGRGSKTLRVWDLQTGDLEVFDLPEGSSSLPAGLFQGIDDLAFADESTLFSAGDGGIRRWDLESGEHELVFAARPGHHATMAVGRNGRTALVLEGAMAEDREGWGPLKVVDLATGATRELPAFGDPVRQAIALDASGTVAASGDREGILRVGRLSGGEPHLLLGHEGAIDFVSISPDERWVASTGEDDTLRLWPMPDLDEPPLHTLPRERLIGKLKTLTNLRAVRDPEAPNGWTIELDTFPGWKDVPRW